MKYSPHCLILLALFIACSSPQTEPLQRPDFWGPLEPGTYNVGFKSIQTYDITRPPVSFSDWSGNIKPNKETKGRQMLINVWYPAESGSREQQLTMEDYLNLFSQQVDFSGDESVLEFGATDYILKSNLLPGSDSTFTREQLDLLLPLKGYAAHNAQELAEPFPLIVFPNGMAPVTTHITGEYLASHGYVVVSISVKGPSLSTIDASAKGIEIGVRDLDFVLSNALTWPNVDRNGIGLVGNAIESSFITALQNRNPMIKSLVSLEGGLLSSFEQRLLNETPFYSPEAVDVPILAIYAPHPAINPKHIEHLEYSDRYLAHFPGMTEFHFLSYGMYEPITLGIIGPKRGDTQQGFTEAHKLVKDFFEMTLKQSDMNFAQRLNDLNPAIVDTAFIMPATTTDSN